MSKVIIYGKPNCPFCERAKSLCQAQNRSYEYQTVGVDITKEQLEEKVGRPIRTVPQIFIMEDGFAEYVGGFQELARRI